MCFCSSYDGMAYRCSVPGAGFGKAMATPPKMARRLIRLVESFILLRDVVVVVVLCLCG